MRSLVHRFSLALVVASALSASGLAFAHGNDQDEVRHAMMSVFDKPSEPLKVNPVVSAGDHAVAGWTQGGKGGRAVLQKTHGKWSIVVCGGDGLKDPAALVQTGMPPATAATLAKAMASAESKLNPELVRQFGMFDGIVKVDAGHGAGPAKHHAEQTAIKK